MKKNLLLGVVLMTTLSISAQTTMTDANFPRTGTFSHTQINDDTGITLPSMGAAQSWDYSGLSEESSSTHSHTDATGDPMFTTSNNYSNWTYTFQGLVYYANHFEAMNSTAWTLEGRRIAGDVFSIQGVTGDANDTLKFDSYDDVFATPLVQLQFPAAYGNAWTSNYVTTTPFKLTVNSYGLNNEPGVQYRYKSLQYEVVGDGQLIIPLSTGAGPAPARDAILVQRILMNLDSTFLSGAPAPPALMTAFGLTQGAISGDTAYLFYTPDLLAELLTVGTPNASHPMNWARYSGNADDLGITENGIALSPIVYPNPVNKGNNFTMEFNNELKITQVRIVSLTGKVIYNEEAAFNGSSLTITAPANADSGLYFVELESADSNIQPQLIHIK